MQKDQKHFVFNKAGSYIAFYKNRLLDRKLSPVRCNFCILISDALKLSIKRKKYPTVLLSYSPFLAHNFGVNAEEISFRFIPIIRKKFCDKAETWQHGFYWEKLERTVESRYEKKATCLHYLVPDCTNHISLQNQPFGKKKH